MINYDELVQRLREQYMDTKQMLPNVLCHDSADAITALQARVAELEHTNSARVDQAERERDALKDELRRTCEHLGLDRLLAERDALRALLRGARDVIIGAVQTQRMVENIVQRIDAALAGEDAT